jgi:hypothetical protein
VFAKIRERISEHVFVPEDRAAGVLATLALWVMLTYAYRAWCSVPYLYVGGPLGSGKSRLFEVLAELVFRPLMSSNVTAPCLYRTLNRDGNVLLLDEAERLCTSSSDSRDILSCLLAGYRAGGTFKRLTRVRGSDFRTESFEVYGPKAIACIAGVPPTLASRCITVTMSRPPSGSHRLSDWPGNPATWQGVRDMLHCFALGHGQRFLELARQPITGITLTGRDRELWQPLLALASMADADGAEGLAKTVHKHAEAMIESTGEDQVPETDSVLLRTLASCIRSGTTPTCKEILNTAKAAEPHLFPRWTPKGVSAVLGRYGLRTKSTNGKRRYRDVSITKLVGIASSYKMDLGLS